MIEAEQTVLVGTPIDGVWDYIRDIVGGRTSCRNAGMHGSSMESVTMDP